MSYNPTRVTYTTVGAITTIGNASSVIVAANTARRYLVIVNDAATAALYMQVGAAAVRNRGIRLNAAGGTFEMSEGNGNLSFAAVNGITASIATLAVTVQEGTVV